MIRVFLVDDHEVVRRGVAALLQVEPDIEIVGEAATVAQALTRIPATLPDVVVLDVRLPDGSGIEVCRQLHEAAHPIRSLLLTSYDDDEAVQAAVLAGAAGYLLKEVAGNRLVEGVRRIAAGQSLLDPAITELVLRRLREPEDLDPRISQLTPREREILVRIAEGMTNREIGAELYIAEKTVKNAITTLLAKLQMQRRTQVAVFVVEHREELHEQYEHMLQQRDIGRTDGG